MPATPPPLTPAVDEVIVATDAAKLPPAIAALLDPAVPLPDGVTFFERRITAGDVMTRAIWACVGGVLAVVTIPLGLYEIFHPTGPVTVSSRGDWAILGFGLVCGLVAWVGADGVVSGLRVSSAQRAGRPTRVGLFLTPSALVDATDSTTTVVPRRQVRGLADNSVRYARGERVQSINLPAAPAGEDPSAIRDAVNAWLTG